MNLKLKKIKEIVLEITDTSVKIFTSKMIGEKRRVSFCQIQDLCIGSNEDIGAILKESKHLKNIRSLEVCIIIPRREVILKQMRLPTEIGSDLEKMIPLQIVTQLPFSLENISYDYDVLEAGEGYSKVLVTILRKETAFQYLNYFKMSKVTPSKMILSSRGLLGWFLHQRSKLRSADKKSIALINVDTVNTEICFYFAGKLYFSRSIEFLRKEQHGDKFNSFLDTIKRSMASYQKDKMGPAVESIIILWQSQEVFGLKKILEKKFNLPIEVIDSIEDLSISEVENLSCLGDKEGISLSAGSGLLFSSERNITHNLMPSEIRQRRVKRNQNRDLMKFIFISAVCLSLFLLNLKIDNLKKSERLKDINREISETIHQVKSLTSQELSIHLLNIRLNQYVFFPELLLKVYQMVPQGVTINSLDFNKDYDFVISGDADSGIIVNDFQSNLLNSSTFSDVNLQSSSKRKIHKREVFSFRIKLKVVSDFKQY